LLEGRWGAAARRSFGWIVSPPLTYLYGNCRPKIRKSLEIFREGTADYTDFTDKDSRSVAKTTPLR